MDKENRQISPSLCLPKGAVDIFAGTVSLFNKTEVGTIRKDFSDLLLLNLMLVHQFFNNVLKPYEARNLQRAFLLCSQGGVQCDPK